MPKIIFYRYFILYDNTKWCVKWKEIYNFYTFRNDIKQFNMHSTLTESYWCGWIFCLNNSYTSLRVFWYELCTLLENGEMFALANIAFNKLQKGLLDFLLTVTFFCHS